MNGSMMYLVVLLCCHTVCVILRDTEKLEREVESKLVRVEMWMFVRYPTFKTESGLWSEYWYILIVYAKFFNRVIFG